MISQISPKMSTCSLLSVTAFLDFPVLESDWLSVRHSMLHSLFQLIRNKVASAASTRKSVSADRVLFATHFIRLDCHAIGAKVLPLSSMIRIT